MIRFDTVAIDLPGRVVELDGSVQHLEPQAFDLLAYLLSHRDRVVPHAELLDQVWGDQFVSAAALTTRIKEIRHAVGDDGTRQSVIRTHRGRGYRFVAPVDDLEEGSAAEPAAATGAALIGRDEEIERIDELLANSVVVTLAGPGGVGKTTLARQVASRRGHLYGDGVRYVELAPVEAPDDVVHVMRQASGLEGAGNSERELTDAVAELDALVVFDNCEHLIDEASRLIDSIVRANGSAQVLATSREPLGIPSEAVCPISPLAPEAARELLTSRITAQGHDPDLDIDDAVLAELAALVDHLPLAIEMAAAQLTSMSAQEAIDLLEHRLDLLRSADRSNDGRHRTLPALIEWSERLLETDAQRLLLEMSVFAGPVSAVDIARVVDADVAELVSGPLTELVAHSLLVAHTEQRPSRYGMLQTVRACLTGRRDPGVDRRHAEHFADAVRSADRLLRTPQEAKAARRIESLVPELRVAHRWARSNDPELAADMTASLLHYAHERQWAEPATWAEQLLATHGSADTAAAAAASMAADASNRGDYETAERLAERATSSGDERVVGMAFDTLINVGLYNGDFDATSLHGRRLAEIASDTTDRHVRTVCQLNAILAPLYAGELEEARAALESIERIESGPPTTDAWLSYARGEVESASGDADAAVASFDRAIELGSSVGSNFVVSVSQVSSLAAIARSGSIDDALVAFGPVLEHYRRIRSLTHAITALRNLIGLLVRAEVDQPAMELLGALRGNDTKRAYGAEVDLMARARATVESRQHPEVVEDWIELGAAGDPEWALDRAIELLESY